MEKIIQFWADFDGALSADLILTSEGRLIKRYHGGWEDITPNLEKIPIKKDNDTFFANVVCDDCLTNKKV